jgi:Zn-finger nucleic acid-binding protein
MSERQGIEIDYCATCRGVWLDRGELDKIVERTAGGQSAPAPTQAPPPESPHYGTPHQGYHKPHHKRRKSFLEELFD